jgi:hypothetical protein
LTTSKRRSNRAQNEQSHSGRASPPDQIHLGLQTSQGKKSSCMRGFQPVGAPGFEPGTSSPPRLVQPSGGGRTDVARSGLTRSIAGARAQATPHGSVSRFRDVWARIGHGACASGRAVGCPAMVSLEDFDRYCEEHDVQPGQDGAAFDTDSATRDYVGPAPHGHHMAGSTLLLLGEPRRLGGCFGRVVDRHPRPRWPSSSTAAGSSGQATPAHPPGVIGHGGLSRAEDEIGEASALRRDLRHSTPVVR